MRLLQGDKEMLTRLLPEQVSEFWDVIKFGIEHSLAPIAGEHPDKMNRVLASLLSGTAQCWASYVKDEGNVKFEGILVTKMLYDEVSDTKNLLLYCVYGYTNVEQSTWINGLVKVTKYAKAKGCSNIVAYTDVPYLIKIASDLGANTKFTFISFNVNESVQKLDELGLLKE
jgi:hypothetical protein